MYLLSETIKNINNEIVLEEDKINPEIKKKNYYIVASEGIQVDKENQNGRIYPKSIVEKKLNESYIPNFVNNGRAWGEFGHPENAKINENRISHRFVSIRPNGNFFYEVKAKIMDNPNGNMIKSLIEDGEGKLGISTRALGTVKEKNGIQEVQDDLHFVTAGDVVADPSAQNAFVRGILEGKTYDWVNGTLIESVVKEIKEEYKITMPVEEKQKLILNGFEYFKEKLNESSNLHHKFDVIGIYINPDNIRFLKRGNTVLFEFRPKSGVSQRFLTTENSNVVNAIVNEKSIEYENLKNDLYDLIRSKFNNLNNDLGFEITKFLNNYKSH
jgi:hypothetical protein